MSEMIYVEGVAKVDEVELSKHEYNEVKVENGIKLALTNAEILTLFKLVNGNIEAGGQGLFRTDLWSKLRKVAKAIQVSGQGE